jgi:retron-type reverse transcriptase
VACEVPENSRPSQIARKGGASYGKRDPPEVCDFEYHLDPRLCEIRHELISGAYQWGAYRQFLIRDPKRPIIRAAPFRDRVVHHAIFNVLDPVIRGGFIRDTYACIPGRGSHSAVDRLWRFIVLALRTSHRQNYEHVDARCSNPPGNAS